MKKLMILSAVLVLACSIKAQNPGYKTAIGWRFGVTQGLTVKAALKNNAAFEGILAIWPYGMGITGLYEIHRSTGTNGLNWYYGGGAHINWATYRNYYYYRPERRFYPGSPRTAFGVDGIIGLEYRIPKTPLAFSLDLKPTYSFYNDGESYVYLDPGLGLKFAF